MPTFASSNTLHLLDAVFTAEQKSAIHFKIAQLLHDAAQSPPTDVELFAIVKHFNKAAASVPASSRRTVVALNIAALESARTGASYETAYVSNY